LEDAPAEKPKHEQSPARVRIRKTYDEITAARLRGVSWRQIADLMNRDGITGTNGAPLTATNVRSLYAVEKASRGERRKRRTKKPVTQPQTRTPETIPTPEQPRSAVPFDPNDGAPPDKPKPRFSGPSRPR
jgi:hypothetical protein